MMDAVSPTPAVRTPIAMSPPRPAPLPLVVRPTIASSVAILAVACTRTDPTAPTRATVPLPLATVSAAASTNGQGPQACTPDSKLLGRYAVSTADAPGTWWYLSRQRFDAAGVTDYRVALENFYSQSFATLGDAIDYLIAGVAAYDANGNGYVCAFEVNGTRAHLGANSAFLIGIADDKHAAP